MTRRFTQILVCLFVCFTFEDILAAEPLAQSILVIDQSEPNSPISRPMRNAFRSVLYSNADVARTVYLEPLNIQRFRGARYWEITYNYLKEKYRANKLTSLSPSAQRHLTLFRPIVRLSGHQLQLCLDLLMMRLLPTRRCLQTQPALRYIAASK